MYKTEHIYWMPKTLSINIIDSKLKARVINWHVPTTRGRGVREIWGKLELAKRDPEMRQKVSWEEEEGRTVRSSCYVLCMSCSH